SRLLLDNIAHIKAYWVMLGTSIAQVALRFGADDLDGTINDGGSLMESYLAEGHNNQLTRDGIEEMIHGAGRLPVERDTLYNPIERRAQPANVPKPNASLPVLNRNEGDALKTV